MVMDDDPAGRDEHYERFVACFAKWEPDLRRFIRSLLPTADDTDEVLQRTAIAIWRKFDQFDPETNFMKWACVVARFEVLAYRRKMARDRLVFREEILELMAEESVGEMDHRRAEEEALERCLGQLPEGHRNLLTRAYTPGIRIADLAEEAGASAAALYTRLNRMRKGLLECMERNLAKEGSR